MSNTQTHDRLPLAVAGGIAERVITELAPHCERLEIAGSIRRERSDVKDIEIVCIPQTTIIPNGLFEAQTVRTEGFIQTVQQWTKIKGDPEKGKYTQRLHPEGIAIDIFIVNKNNWGLQLLVRTGPWTFSKDILGRLVKKAGYYSKGGYLYKRSRDKNRPDERIHIREEEDMFRLIGLPYIKPMFRL